MKAEYATAIRFRLDYLHAKEPDCTHEGTCAGCFMIRAAFLAGGSTGATVRLKDMAAKNTLCGLTHATANAGVATKCPKMSGNVEHARAKRPAPQRVQTMSFFVNLPPCLIGMEACPSARFWARKLAALGHGEADGTAVREALAQERCGRCAATCEAVARLSMRFVPIKNQEQQQRTVSRPQS